MPTIPAPDAQSRAFYAKLGERLGFDPGQVIDLRWETSIASADTMKVEWTTVAFLPADEVLEMFNAHGKVE